MCLGLSAVEGITEVTGLTPRLKWPNDLTLDGLKLGGMLSEVKSTGDRLEYAVLGLGLNVNLSFSADGEDAPPAEIIGAATSLSAALGRPVDRGALLAAILQRCETRYDELLADPGGGDALERGLGQRNLKRWGRRSSSRCPPRRCAGAPWASPRKAR